MVFIPEGMGIRIPAGGLSIGIGSDGKPQASLSKLEVAYEIWPDWVDIATEHAEDALTHRQQLADLLASDTDQPQMKAGAMTSECRASMVAITASVTALDAFYAGVSQRLPDYETLRSQWESQKKRPSRPGQVSQILWRAFAYEPAIYQKLKKSLSELYRIRNAAVHPRADYQAPVRHDLLSVGVEWRFVAFSATNAIKAVALSCDIIQHSAENPRKSKLEIAEWSQHVLPRIRDRHERAQQVANAQD